LARTNRRIEAAIAVFLVLVLMVVGGVAVDPFAPQVAEAFK
jgi:hypothetical protein